MTHFTLTALPTFVAIIPGAEYAVAKIVIGLIAAVVAVVSSASSSDGKGKDKS